jgi:hypothetical protein
MTGEGNREARRDGWIGGLHEKENRKKLKKRGIILQTSERARETTNYIEVTLW